MVLSLALRKSLSTSASVAGDMTFLIMVEIMWTGKVLGCGGLFSPEAVPGLVGLLDREKCHPMYLRALASNK